VLIRRGERAVAVRGPEVVPLAAEIEASGGMRLGALGVPVVDE
jgi:hypothetical protein